MIQLSRMVFETKGALFAAHHPSAHRVARHAIFHLSVFVRDGAGATRAVVLRPDHPRTWRAFPRWASIAGRPNRRRLATLTFRSGGRFRFWSGLCGRTVPELRPRAGQCSGSEKTAYNNSNCASPQIPSGFHGSICSTTITPHGPNSLGRPCASLGQTCAVFARPEGAIPREHTVTDDLTDATAKA